MASLHFEESDHADLYARFRPEPPEEIVDAILDAVSIADGGGRDLVALDVGCGSGQATSVLARRFGAVRGFDASRSQIAQARVRFAGVSNVTFEVGPAESLPVPASSVDAVVVCEALHWFDLAEFYREVDSVLRPGGVLAAMGYTVFAASPRDGVDHAEVARLGDEYWDAVKVHADPKCFALDDKYAEFAFPYDDVRRIDRCDGEATEISVAEAVGFNKSVSAYQRFAKFEGGAAAEKVIRTYREGMLKAVGRAGATTDDDDDTSAKFEIRFPFFAVINKKPLENPTLP